MKVPKARKLPSGTWFIQLRLGGQSIPVTAPTEDKCTKAAQLIKAQYQAGQKSTTPKTDLTLSDAIDKYIDRRKNTLSPSTIRGYRAVQRLHFPRQMSQPVTRRHDWQAVVDAEAATYSPKTLKNAWGFVASVLRENGVTAPELAFGQITAGKRPWLEPEEIPVFVEAVRASRYAIPALLALHGLRRSEIFGLTWEHVDLKKQTIAISGARVFDAENKLIHKSSNKNVTSTRRIPIMIPDLGAALDAIEDKNGFVVNCYPDTVRIHINRICKENGLPEVGIHGLRYSFASLAYHLGLSERETMDIGGWADPQTMHKIYIRLAAADRLKAQNKMAAFYSAKNKAARIF